MISDEQRSAITDLAFQALDSISEDYGEDASLGDAILVYEVLIPDKEHPEETWTEARVHATTQRTAVASGLLTLANEQILTLRRYDEGEED